MHFGGDRLKQLTRVGLSIVAGAGVLTAAGLEFPPKANDVPRNEQSADGQGLSHALNHALDNIGKEYNLRQHEMSPHLRLPGSWEIWE
ncbi:MAG TPA: hypothetical protein VLG27_03725 [Candidatus Saccharimonadia bacterium]|nr:hypothetical protein [Candidatus Saccharimonadia bacterium]